MSQTSERPVPVRQALLQYLKQLGKQLMWAVPVWAVVFGSYAAFYWYRYESTTHGERLAAILIPLVAVFLASVGVSAYRIARWSRSGRPRDVEPSRFSGPIQVGFCFMILGFGILMGSVLSLDAAPASVLVGNIGMYLVPPVVFAAHVVILTWMRLPSPSWPSDSTDAKHGMQ